MVLFYIVALAACFGCEWFQSRKEECDNDEDC